MGREKELLETKQKIMGLSENNPFQNHWLSPQDINLKTILIIYVK